MTDRAELLRVLAVIFSPAIFVATVFLAVAACLLAIRETARKPALSGHATSQVDRRSGRERTLMRSD